MHEALIILAAGVSSRMKKSIAISNLSKTEVAAANTKSKGLIGIGAEQQPLLNYVLRNAKHAGYKDIYLVVGTDAKDFKEYYGNQFEGLQIFYAEQTIPKYRKKPLGTADAVYQALVQFPKLKNTAFTVCNSDNVYSIEAMEQLRTTNERNALISYDRDGLDFSLKRIASFALLSIDKDGYVQGFIEKPDASEIENYRDASGKLRLSMNIYKFSGEAIFRYLENCPIHPVRNEKELPTSVMNMCVAIPDALKALPRKEHVPDLTSKEDIALLKDKDLGSLR